MKHSIFTITGPSGVGKSTLIDAVEKQCDARQIHSYTTRPLRNNSTDQRILISPQDFVTREQRGEFIESIRYDGFAYAIPKDAVNRALENGPAILDCNFSGVQQVKNNNLAPVTAIFLLADAQTLYNRQMMRAAGSLASRINRLKLALEEVDGISSGLFDYIIVNNDLPTATDKILRIIRGESILSDSVDIAKFKCELKHLIDMLENSLAGKEG